MLGSYKSRCRNSLVLIHLHQAKSDPSLSFFLPGVCVKHMTRVSSMCVLATRVSWHTYVSWYTVFIFNIFFFTITRSLFFFWYVCQAYVCRGETCIMTHIRVMIYSWRHTQFFSYYLYIFFITTRSFFIKTKHQRQKSCNEICMWLCVVVTRFSWHTCVSWWLVSDNECRFCFEKHMYDTCVSVWHACHGSGVLWWKLCTLKKLIYGIEKINYFIFLSRKLKFVLFQIITSYW